MGDVAGGDIARRRWMERDAGRKQQRINMERKKCGVLVFFTSIFFVIIHIQTYATNKILFYILCIHFHIQILYL